MTQAVTDIRTALLRWKVVFFRDQRLDHTGQLKFARHFGDLTTGHPIFDSARDDERIYPIDQGRFTKRYTGPSDDGLFAGWHSDVTAALNPPWGSILRAEVIPPVRRRHPVDEPGCRLRGPVRATSALGRRPEGCSYFSAPGTPKRRRTISDARAPAAEDRASRSSGFTPRPANGPST